VSGIYRNRCVRYLPKKYKAARELSVFISEAISRLRQSFKEETPVLRGL
jgi:hypothetical protein